MNVGEFFAEYWSVLLSAILTLASLIWAIIQSKKTGNKSGLLEMSSLIPTFCSEAEEMFGKGNGVAKLNFVLTKLRIYALEHNIRTNSKSLEEQINNYVASTKIVNAEKTPTLEATQTSNNNLNSMVESGSTNNQVNVNI